MLCVSVLVPQHLSLYPLLNTHMHRHLHGSSAPPPPPCLLARIIRPASSSLSVACGSCCRWWLPMNIYHIGFECSRRERPTKRSVGTASVLTAPNGVHGAERGRFRGREVREEERERERISKRLPLLEVHTSAVCARVHSVRVCNATAVAGQRSFATRHENRLSGAILFFLAPHTQYHLP
jgi:hypothetical protein